MYKIFSFIKNNTKLQTTSTGERINIPLVYLYNGICATLQNCQSGTCYNMNEIYRCYTDPQ